MGLSPALRLDSPKIDLECRLWENSSVALEQCVPPTSKIAVKECQDIRISDRESAGGVNFYIAVTFRHDDRHIAEAIMHSAIDGHYIHAGKHLAECLCSLTLHLPCLSVCFFTRLVSPF